MCFAVSCYFFHDFIAKSSMTSCLVVLRYVHKAGLFCFVCPLHRLAVDQNCFQVRNKLFLDFSVQVT